jgi:phosphohistidine phosphatase SixA
MGDGGHRRMTGHGDRRISRAARWRVTTASIVVSLAVAVTGAVAQEAQVVILVRHAEKATEPPSDVALSADGVARATALSDALADAGIDAIVTTQFRRTRETAAPLAAALGVTPRVVDAGEDERAHVRAVADAVRGAGRAVLVVGHSNTVPAIIGALGGPRLEELCESEYANLFTLVLAPEQPARLIRATYGAPDPPSAGSCHKGMTQGR